MAQVHSFVEATTTVAADGGLNGRVNPVQLPVRFRASATEPRRLNDRSGPGLMDVQIDRSKVRMGRTVANGVPIRLSLSLDAYSGVAARIDTSNSDDRPAVYLELAHQDPALTVPLASGGDFQAIAEDWKRWSELLSLPMVLIEADGSLSQLPEDAVSYQACQGCERRFHYQTKTRRGRFARRRKCGQLDLTNNRADGREITART